MATTNNTSKTNTTTNSGNAVSNNIIDALIYTGIKNNLTKTNYTPYDLLLTKIGSTDDQDRLNNILYPHYIFMFVAGYPKGISSLEDKT